MYFLLFTDVLRKKAVWIVLAALTCLAVLLMWGALDVEKLDPQSNAYARCGAASPSGPRLSSAIHFLL